MYVTLFVYIRIAFDSEFRTQDLIFEQLSQKELFHTREKESIFFQREKVQLFFRKIKKNEKPLWNF